MIDVREAATRKIGPLPAWAWGAVIGGGFLIYRFATGGGGGASSSNVDTIAGGTPFDYDAAAGGGGGAGGGGVLSSDGSVAPGIVDAPTNAGRSVPTPRRTVPTPTVIVQTPVTPLVQSNQATRRTGDTSRRPANPFPLPLGLPVWRADAVADDVSASMDAYMLTPPGVPSYPIPVPGSVTMPTLPPIPTVVGDTRSNLDPRGWVVLIEQETRSKIAPTIRSRVTIPTSVRHGIGRLRASQSG